MILTLYLYVFRLIFNIQNRKIDLSDQTKGINVIKIYIGLRSYSRKIIIQ